MNKQQQRGQEWLEKLLVLMGMAASVEMTDSGQDDACWLTINENSLTPEQIELLIGQRGKNIDAIQYLINSIVNIGVESDLQQPFTVELANYRVKRQAELQQLLEEVMEKVRTTGEEVEMTDLSSAERRQVHHLLQNETDLTTESRGSEPHRRLFVRLR